MSKIEDTSLPSSREHNGKNVVDEYVPNYLILYIKIKRLISFFICISIYLTPKQNSKKTFLIFINMYFYTNNYFL